jgi:hypothetical protein
MNTSDEDLCLELLQVEGVDVIWHRTLDGTFHCHILVWHFCS